MATELVSDATDTRSARNKLRPADRAVHDWYRFVLSFPPHLVRNYIDQFGISDSDTVLDPFCGTGTTLVECKKLGISSVGIESTPMAHFASSVKTDWSVDPSALSKYAEQVASSARETLKSDGSDQWRDSVYLENDAEPPSPLRTLEPERSRLLLKNSISPLPLHKTLVLRDALDSRGDSSLRLYGRLALANALICDIGNLKFGPEVGIGKIKDDASVIDSWLSYLSAMASDVENVTHWPEVPACVFKADARIAGRVLDPESIDCVITSPPYPNEKDYTRTTRLESVILGLIRDRHHLRSQKQRLVRSNTRSVYKGDADDQTVTYHSEIQNIADEIERRRIELGKTSGFERLYSRVTRLYFGGMTRHLQSLQTALRPGAKLAYVVGDQASYLRVMIRTGQILADLAQTLGYRVIGIDLFRTRLSTVTGEQLREEVVLLEWPGGI